MIENEPKNTQSQPGTPEDKDVDIEHPQSGMTTGAEAIDPPDYSHDDGLIQYD